MIVAKNYEDNEEKSRFSKFSKNFQTILKHNAEQDKGMHSYRLGLNEYADLVSVLYYYSNMQKSIIITKSSLES